MTTAIIDVGTPDVAKTRKKTNGEGPQPPEPQVTFRLSPELHARVKAASSGLELDLSSLLRLMIREHLPEYEDRAEAIRRRESKEGE